PCSGASRRRSGMRSGCGGRRSPGRRYRRSIASRSIVSEEDRPAVSVPMPRVLGYAEPLSVAAGEAVRFMVGPLAGPRPYRAQIVRIVSGASGPDGPGLKTVHLPTSIDGEHAGTPQPIDAGSYVIVERPEAFGGLTRFTLQAFIQPTR